MRSLFDTIVAPITGATPSPVAWIRLSGPDALRVAAAVFFPSSKSRTGFPPRVAVYGTWVHGDDGIAISFPGTAGFTGESSVEISMHGSRASVQAALEACVAEGARSAEPGEFTQRAFLNGKIDLTQAEAVKETIESETKCQLTLANANREGSLSREVSELRQSAFRMLAAIEASVDFSEEIGEFDRSSGIREVQTMLDQVERLLRSAETGRLVREGYRIALVGKPNAGKSSLLNRILGSERAIVTAVPGTTRDTIEEKVDVKGAMVVFIDTAGLRETDDEVEQLGIQRSRSAVESADAVWYLFDATAGWDGDDDRLVDSIGRAPLILANKSDLVTSPIGIGISAQTGQGVDSLLQQVRETVLTVGFASAINARQADVLASSQATLLRLDTALRSEEPDDLLSVLLRDLVHELGTLTGETAEPDMVTRIFADFCIGK